MLMRSPLSDLPDLEREPAEAVIAWAHRTHGDGLVLLASMTDAVLIDLATHVAPDLEVVLLDTGFHFAETLTTLKTAVSRYQLRITVERPAASAPHVWEAGADACCNARKVAPMERALEGRTARLSGLRRSDAPGRSATPVVQLDRRGLVKVNPLAAWTDADVEAYIAHNDVVVNPLIAEGYPSIGCWPCTEPVLDGDDRAGRWAGSDKVECGLHL